MNLFWNRASASRGHLTRTAHEQLIKAYSVFCFSTRQPNASNDECRIYCMDATSQKLRMAVFNYSMQFAAIFYSLMADFSKEV